MPSHCASSTGHIPDWLSPQEVRCKKLSPLKCWETHSALPSSPPERSHLFGPLLDSMFLEKRRAPGKQTTVHREGLQRSSTAPDLVSVRPVRGASSANLPDAIISFAHIEDLDGCPLERRSVPCIYKQHTRLSHFVRQVIGSSPIASASKFRKITTCPPLRRVSFFCGGEPTGRGNAA